jgi:hypothetical protein
MVAVIMVRAQRLQAEDTDREASRWPEVSRDERVIVGHRVPTPTIRETLASGYRLELSTSGQGLMVEH